MGERCEKRAMYTITCDQCGREYGAWFDDAEDMRRQAFDDDWQDHMGKDGHRSWRCPDHWLFRCACCGRRFVRDRPTGTSLVRPRRMCATTASRPAGNRNPPKTMTGGSSAGPWDLTRTGRTSR